MVRAMVLAVAVALVGGCGGIAPGEETLFADSSELTGNPCQTTVPHTECTDEQAAHCHFGKDGCNFYSDGAVCCDP